MLTHNMPGMEPIQGITQGNLINASIKLIRISLQPLLPDTALAALPGNLAKKLLMTWCKAISDHHQL